MLYGRKPLVSISNDFVAGPTITVESNVPDGESSCNMNIFTREKPPDE